MRINTNLSALYALRNLNTTVDQLNESINRLSTGLRITTAADDPAGLVISENLRSQVLAMDQASRNSQDAINMMKTAEGALAEIQSLLRGMRALAVHSANTGVVDSNVLDANQSQIRSTIESINRIARNTAFGSKNLLDGTAGAQASVTQPDLVSSIYMGGTFNGRPVANGTITISNFSAATRAQISGDVDYASSSAIVPQGTLTINGVSVLSSGTETLQSFVGRINQLAAITGVTATIVGNGPYQVQLNRIDYGANFGIQLFDSSGLISSTSPATANGTNAEADITVMTDNGAETVRFVGGQGSDVSGLRLSDPSGNVVRLTEQGNQSISGAMAIGVLTADSIQIQFGPSVNQFTKISIPSLLANQLGTGAVSGQSIATIDVTHLSGAQDAIRVIDDAINQVSRIRGELGSFQKDFLESNIRSLGVARENLTATESQIRDADIAEEITQLTKLQILQQSGMAVLAQANQLPSSVLQLLRS